MSELAFNINGERFEPPVAALNWRVRRLKPGGRGLPEVVFGRDGLPLVIPVDTEITEFRRLVDHAPGRYRLDPIDDQQKPCGEGTAAYVQVAEGGGGANPGEEREPVRDQLLRDVVRANAEMVRTIADRFAGVMESAATLLRAADGAGLPARQPPPLPAAQVSAEDEGPDLPNRSELSEFLAQVLPLVQYAVAQRWGAKAPLGKPAAVTAPPASAAATGKAPAATSDAPTEASGPAQGSPGGTLAHFAAIQARLTPEEAALAQAAAKELSPAEIQAWMDQLAQVSVDDAVALVRKAIAAKGATS